MKKLENLLKFEEFAKNYNSEKSIKTKRTETGLDILKEGVENFEFDIDYAIDNLNEQDIEILVNKVRSLFTKMEQDNLIDSEILDELDDIHDGNWYSWLSDAIPMLNLSDEEVEQLFLTLDDDSEIKSYSDDNQIDFEDVVEDED